MTVYSIYHFWKHLVRHKSSFLRDIKLDEFEFDTAMISCKNVGQFPDLAIRLNNNRSVFTGGELIELKESKTYRISSFNSTIPTGKKNIQKLSRSKKSKIFSQMIKAGDDVFSLEERDVYYLVRGRKGNHQKICLVHGSFFETIDVKDLISRSFAQVLEEKNISEKDKKRLNAIFSEQADFSRVRNVEKASVSLRFRILTDVKPQGNILDPSQYADIMDDTLNFVVPFHNENQKLDVIQKMQLVAGKNGMKKFTSFPLKHPLNGWFLVFQVHL